MVINSAFRLRNEDNDKYQEHKKKMRNIAESRKNMRVDMRASVLAKTMTKELIFVSFGLLCAIGILLQLTYFGLGMPLYYLKIKHIKEEYVEEY